ncbi:flavin reductase family protein [bacterium]|nr:flavin reductase family protein [bacterium]
MRIDPASLSPGRRYFLMISCIIPRPIAWVSTLNEDGSHNLAPFSFFNAFSATPPILGIGFAPHEDKGEKDTLRNLRRSGELTVSMATVPMAERLVETSADLPYGTDEAAAAGVELQASELVGPPRVADSPVSFECTVWELKALGDAGSVLLLAEVKLLHIQDTLFNYYGVVDPYKFDALARLGGISYGGLGERFDLRSGGG